jgi:uncharacterized protein (DUF4415 family)
MTESKRALGSNLARLDATTDEEIARHMVEDDSPEWTAEDFARAEVWDGNKFLGHGRDFENGKRKAGRPKGSGTKELVTLRIDRDILDHFRAGGPGWQTRLNDALREVTSATSGVDEGVVHGWSAPVGRQLGTDEGVAHQWSTPVGTNARLIIEVLKAMPAGTARPAEIKKALQDDKGVAMAFTSIRHALGQLATRNEVAASEDGKTWHYIERDTMTGQFLRSDSPGRRRPAARKS